MRAVGLITEYNPFHNGHLHHLRESLRVSDTEVAVAVMSGQFLQRGQPALLDKWVRTEMALACGVDVVVELPLPFACNSAPHFADGAIALLAALGVSDLCFGSEAGVLGPLQRCAGLLREQGQALQAATTAALRCGVAYPHARAAFAAGRLDPEATAALGSPNNILGIEYLRALTANGGTIAPHTIPRRGAGYHDPTPCGAIASATGIRRLLAAGGDISPYLSAAALPFLNAALRQCAILDEGSLLRLVSARLLRDPATLEGLCQMDPGMARRCHAAALESASFEQLALAVKGRQLTLTRVQRLLCYALLEMPQAEMGRYLSAGPLYLRLLGCSRRGERFLAAMRPHRTLPLLGNLSRAGAVLRRHYGAGTATCRMAEEMLQADVHATCVHTLMQAHWPGGKRNRDYFEAVRRV